MYFNEELNLLIKSKHPLIYFETIDENYAIKQLKTIASQTNINYFQWSLTDGLKRGNNDSSYYRTKLPSDMINMVQSLLNHHDRSFAEPALFVLKNFEKHFSDLLVLQLFKDAIDDAKRTKSIFVIISAEYSLPKEIEIHSTHLVGGYPVDEEIKNIIKDMAEELQRTNKKLVFNFNDTELKKIASAMRGLSIQQIRNVVNKCFLADNTLDMNDWNAIEAYKKKVFDQGEVLEFYITKDAHSIGDFYNLKRWLSERRGSFSSEKSSSLPAPKGVLLMGVQGCGKSLAARVIARELGLSLYRLDMARLYSKYIGETEQNLLKTLKIIDSLSPICLWIDEIEKGFASSGGSVDGGVSMRVLGSFLTWLQERQSNCFVVATANNINLLPPEFLRKGRFDEIFFVDLPKAKTREEILKIHLEKRSLDSGSLDLKKIAKISEDFSGAELEQAIISALYKTETAKEKLTTEHIIYQIQNTKPLAIMKKEEIMALRLWAKERTIPV